MDEECEGSVHSNRQPNIPFPSSGRHTTSLAPSTAELNAASVASLAASKASLKPGGACGLSFTLKLATVDESKGSLPESRHVATSASGRSKTSPRTTYAVCARSKSGFVILVWRESLSDPSCANRVSIRRPASRQISHFHRSMVPLYGATQAHQYWLGARVIAAA